MLVHERHRGTGGTSRHRLSISRRERLILPEPSCWRCASKAVPSSSPRPWRRWRGIGGVDLSAYIPKDVPIPFGQIYHADHRAWHFLFSAALGVGAGLAGSILPADRAARLPIAETIGAGL